MAVLMQQILAGALGIAALLVIWWCGAHLHHLDENAADDKSPPSDDRRAPTLKTGSPVVVPRQTAPEASVETGQRTPPANLPGHLEAEASGIGAPSIAPIREPVVSTVVEGNESREVQPRQPKRKDGETDAAYEARKQRRLQRLQATDAATDSECEKQGGPKRRKGETDEKLEARRKRRMERRLQRRQTTVASAK